MKNKNYSREEKIEYYNQQIEDLENYIAGKKYRLSKLKQRLEHIKSDNYQDWNSDLEKQLNNK
jgi:predicted RNase H-like nuclease (RuvC/YqgF family)